MDILMNILSLFAGCGVFIAGMNMMSDGLQKSAGAGMKKLLGSISSNRFAGVGVGATVTGIIQSSAATTVMAIGFVNAGIMTLAQATSIIMGANIGTTVTGIIVSLKSLNIGLYASALAFIGVMMTFFKNDKVKQIGHVICGLGLVFIGLDLMSAAFETDAMKSIFINIFASIEFPLLLILCGVLITALIQSSSAVTGLVIIMVGSGALYLDNALFIVLGSNIGTCVTAMLASIGTSTNAKRTAVIHLLFNVIGTVIFTAFIWIFKDAVVSILQTLIANPSMQIAWFHVFFNLITTALLLPFIKQLVALATFIVKDKAKDEKKYQLRYIDDRLLQTPAVAVGQVQKEILYMSEVAQENLKLAVTKLTTDEFVDEDKVRDNEARLNHTYHAIARYLIKLSATSVSEADEKLIGAYHHVISDIERIGDYCENFVDQSHKMEASEIRFSETAVAELVQMYNKVNAMYDMCIHAFSRRDYAALDRIEQIEDEVDDMKDTLSKKHFERLTKGDCIVERGTYFFSVLTSLERIADHLINVAFSIKNPTGSQSKNPEINDVPKSLKVETN